MRFFRVPLTLHHTTKKAKNPSKKGDGKSVFLFTKKGLPRAKNKAKKSIFQRKNRPFSGRFFLLFYKIFSISFRLFTVKSGLVSGGISLPRGL